MQVSGDGLGSVISSTAKKEGVAGFWKGIAFAWGREGSYASIKLGAYAPVRDAMDPLKAYMPAFLVKFLAGAVTGGVGSGELTTQRFGEIWLLESKHICSHVRTRMPFPFLCSHW